MQWKPIFFVLLTFSLCAVVAGQTEKQKTGCDKAVLIPTSAAPGFDLDFALGSTADPEFAKQDLVSKPASRVAIYAVVPRDRCEMRNVFRRNEGADQHAATEEDLNKIQTLLAPMAGLGAPLAADSRSDRGFGAFVKHTDAAYIAILGHSENGVFRFPDGSWSTLTAMARECARSGKRCLFPACLLSEAPGGGFGSARADSILISKDALNVLRTVKGYIEQ